MTKTVREFLIERNQNPDNFERVLDMQVGFFDGCANPPRFKEVIDVKRFEDFVVVLEDVTYSRGRRSRRPQCEITVYPDRSEDVFVHMYDGEFHEIVSVPTATAIQVWVRLKKAGSSSFGEVRCLLEED